MGDSCKGLKQRILTASGIIGKTRRTAGVGRTDTYRNCNPLIKSLSENFKLLLTKPIT